MLRKSHRSYKNLQDEEKPSLLSQILSPFKSKSKDKDSRDSQSREMTPHIPQPLPAVSLPREDQAHLIQQYEDREKAFQAEQRRRREQEGLAQAQYIQQYEDRQKASQAEQRRRREQEGLEEQARPKQYEDQQNAFWLPAREANRRKQPWQRQREQEEESGDIKDSSSSGGVGVETLYRRPVTPPPPTLPTLPTLPDRSVREEQARLIRQYEDRQKALQTAKEAEEQRQRRERERSEEQVREEQARLLKHYKDQQQKDLQAAAEAEEQRRRRQSEQDKKDRELDEKAREEQARLLKHYEEQHLLEKTRKQQFESEQMQRGQEENQQPVTDVSSNQADLDDVRHIVEGVLEDKQQSRNLLEIKGVDAQLWLDALQVLAELPEVVTTLRSSILKMMLHLSKRSGLCPKCLMVENVIKLGDYAVGGGGFGDVWKGTIGDQIVCLKVVKVYLVSDVKQLMKEYMREGIVWKQLKHPNLLPFMGMYYMDPARGQLCLVSPWMERGNLVHYVKETPAEQVDHYSLVYDVASGLSYLHDRKIVHGDLKGVNILITPEERACIGDFGLSRVSDTHALKLTSTTGHSKGTTRWLAPELLSSDPSSSSSSRSDIYAFACVCYEIFTGSVPFFEIRYDGGVILAIASAQRPTRPSNMILLTDEMWNIMTDCWNHDPQLRPAASKVLEHVTGLENLKMRIKPALDWNVSNLTRIGKDVKYPHVDTAALARLQEKLKFPAVAPFAGPGYGGDHRTDGIDGR